MFCPECGAEYRRGFLECSDCRVPLVAEPPVVDRREKLELETLMEVVNPIRLAVVRSVLEAEGIESIVRGESPSALGGIEFVSRKRAVLLVAKQDLEEARRLVEALELPEDEECVEE